MSLGVEYEVYHVVVVVAVLVVVVVAVVVSHQMRVVTMGVMPTPMTLVCSAL